MREHPRPLPARPPPRLPTLRHRIATVRVTQPDKGKQPRDRGESTIDRRRRISVQPLPVHPNHVRTRPTRHARLPARPQEPQQIISHDLLEGDVLLGQPAAEREQVIPIRTRRRWRVVPVQQMPEILVYQLEPGAGVADEHPLRIATLEPQDFVIGHATHVAPTPQKTNALSVARRVAAKTPDSISRLRGTPRPLPSRNACPGS